MYCKTASFSLVGSPRPTEGTGKLHLIFDVCFCCKQIRHCSQNNDEFGFELVKMQELRAFYSDAQNSLERWRVQNIQRRHSLSALSSDFTFLRRCLT
jgi:hypothetical protein